MEKYKSLVWPEINKYLKDPVYPTQFKIPTKYREISDFHWQLTKDYPERKGKYLRPSLLLLTCESLGGKLKDALKTAAAMQISEEWLLIHDDFEDKSLQRRGKPTLQRIYGDELAVNAGDALHIIMWKILSDNLQILNRQKTLQILDEFYRALSRTALGQSVEIKWYQDNKIDFGDKDWNFICDGKTSYYTAAAPLRLGAIIAGATTAQLDSLTEFGLNLGRCFQLVDDVLDLTSDFGGSKKQTGNDIYEGKRTLILGHLLRTAKADDRKKAVKILGKSREEKTEEEIKWIIQKMHDYGSLDYAGKIAKKYRDQAKNIFATKLGFLTKQPARRNLEEIIDFILERKY